MLYNGIFSIAKILPIRQGYLTGRVTGIYFFNFNYTDVFRQNSISGLRTRDWKVARAKRDLLDMNARTKVLVREHNERVEHCLTTMNNGNEACHHYVTNYRFYYDYHRNIYIDPNQVC